MFKLKRLYTEPALIEPVSFTDGVNIILGEKDDSSNKTNGVGKSLCVEFINFALLKRLTHSRVQKIPADTLPPTTLICLDFDIDAVSYTIKRSPGAAETPTIVIDGAPRPFASLADASTFLGARLFANTPDDPAPSFRAMMGPLIRDERSEFKSLLQPYDTRLRLGEDVEPHLYMFSIDLAAYREVARCIKRFDDVSASLRIVGHNVKLVRGKDIKDARSDLNELEREVSSINAEVDKLENTVGYDAIKSDILAVEADLEQLRTERGILRLKLRKLRAVTNPSEIDGAEVVEFYNALNARLGDLVRRDLDQVMQFKSTIDEFQNRLVSERHQTFSDRLVQIESRIAAQDQRYKSYLSVLDQGGGLKNLKQTYAALKHKSDELAQLSSFVTRYNELDLEKKQASAARQTELFRLETRIAAQADRIKSFEHFILDMHEHIQGNRKASFSVEVLAKPKKRVVEISLRIDDDGSHSVEREKVFIYDLALLLSAATRERHPGLLIHDNIFNVDDDTLSKNFDWLFRHANVARDRQYILTLNTDLMHRLPSDALPLQDVRSCVRASHTKANRFLKRKYQER